jgi:hypothetical protein
MNPLDTIEEKTEVTLASKQIMGLSIGFLVTSLMIFMVGFFMGKRSERRNVNLGADKGTEDLLSKLDKYEARSKKFIAKRALTNLRKREMSLKELDGFRQAELAPKTKDSKLTRKSRKNRGRFIKSSGRKRSFVALARVKRNNKPSRIKVKRKKSVHTKNRKHGRKVAAKPVSRRVRGAWLGSRSRKSISLMKKKSNRQANR